jgi:filamentous hemagglutinin family protein
MRTSWPILAFLAASSFLLDANPTGFKVANGSASIAGQGSSAVTITQGSNTAIINWNTFSIGAGESTSFLQPTGGAALNRVLGGQTSFINGTLSANGQIYLINGNGIVVGAGGIITTAGFIASTRDISDYDFNHGKLQFKGRNDAGVTNLGTITALGGDVVLLGKTVNNKGTINATGTAGLVAGDDILLAQQNADGSTITVEPVSTPSAPTGKQKIGVKNSGTITASTAELKAANGNIYALAIQNEGIVRATTVTQQGGHIYLTADSGTIVNSGTLDASATAATGQGGTILVKSATGKVVHSGKILARGGQGGAGGQVEISGSQVAITGTVDTTATDGTTGNLLLDPASIDVITGGGTDPTASTVDPTTVDSLLNSTGLTLSAQNNITISNDVSWDSGNNFTLVTTTAGSTININAAITNTHATTGSLIIDAAAPTDVISTSLAGAINVPNFILQRGAWVQLVNVGGNGGNLPQTLVNGVLTNVLPGFTATNDFEIDNGTFLRADSGNGGTVYYGLEDIYGLQGMEGFLSSNFTLNGNTIYGSEREENGTTGFDTATWNSGEGFLPIGSESTPYEGEFSNGTIAGVTINQGSESTNVGIFGVTGADAYLDNIAIRNSSITGGTNVGGLVGENSGTLNFGSNYGTIFDNNQTSLVHGSDEVGGLVGLNTSAGTVQFGNTYGAVTGNNSVGGAAGENDGTIYSVQGFASVTGQDNIGGVAGYNTSTGTINASPFSGSVQPGEGESFDLGGIAGENDGTITASNAFPSASVTGDVDVGGLVGFNTGFISDSYNSGTVTGRDNFAGDDGGGTNIGGIAGENQSGNDDESDVQDSIRSDLVNGPVFNANSGVIQTSYNTGTVDGVANVGGIVGLNDSSGTVTTAYNVGSIGDSDATDVGGIVGDNNGIVEFTYDSGPVSGVTGSTAALVGFDEDFAQTNDSYWDIVTSGQTIATNSNIGEEVPDVNAATESDLASVSSTSGTAYTISGNNVLTGAGFGFFGVATLVPNTNGVYEIGTSPDSSGGPAWYIIDGQTRPVLAMEANGNINNPHELQFMAANLNSSYFITSEIDASVITNPAEIWTTAGFDPIGADPNSEGVAFTGTTVQNDAIVADLVEGNGETIQGLYINRPGASNVGLFGYVGSEATIKDVDLNDSSITGNSNVGGLAGTNLGTLTNDQNNNTQEIDNDETDSVKIVSDVNINFNSSSVSGNGDNVGGIVGDNFGQVTSSSNNSFGVASVTGAGNNIGGIAGVNEQGATLGEDSNGGPVQGTEGSDGIGGIVGSNYGTVTQSINMGNVGSDVETNVGGIAGNNFNQIDDSYSGGGSFSGTIDGSGNVGGLVGGNQPDSILETSYSTSTVEGGDGSSTGAVVGANGGAVQHVYWDTDATGDQAGIAENNNADGTNDAVGYTSVQLADITNYAQGSSPGMWDFSPQTGDGGGGIWGVNVYNSSGQVNDGLPVLQWQFPVNTEIAVVGGTQPYGYTPSSTATGEGVSQLSTELPNGSTYNVAGGSDAGDTQTVTITGNPVFGGFNIEYVNGTVNIVPDQLAITANTFVVAPGSPTPTFTSTYTGFQPGHDASDLNGTLTYTATPLPDSAPGLHTITVSGQTSPIGDQGIANYDITYFTGLLNVTNPTPSQIASTFTAEIASIQSQIANDPTNGLSPFFFTIFPDKFGLGGELLGAINNEPDATDYAYASSTSNLPAFSRLATADSGVVEIIDGAVIVGDPKTGKPIFLNQAGTPLSQAVLDGFRDVLSPSVYNELLALIHGG